MAEPDHLFSKLKDYEVFHVMNSQSLAGYARLAKEIAADEEQLAQPYKHNHSQHKITPQPHTTQTSNTINKNAHITNEINKYRKYTKYKTQMSVDKIGTW